MAAGSKNSNTEEGIWRVRRKKTSACSIRVQQDLKDELQALAEKQGRTLSSLLERVLGEVLARHQDISPSIAEAEEKRHHPRRKVLLPARWRIGHGKSVAEHDVIVKDISAGGAYTSYIGGLRFHLFKGMMNSTLALVVRMPEARDPVALDCEARRVHITKDSVDVGLRFTETSIEKRLTL